MAHIEQREFCERVKNMHPNFFKNKKVLDIGSLDINGSNRSLFENCDYVGIDVGEGKNVDVVSVGHLYNGPDNEYDTIISTEVFEHDMFYPQTIQNVMRMLKPGGLFLFTCASPGRPEHGTRRQGEHCAPLLLQVSEQWADYYKNLTELDIRQIDGFDDTFTNTYFEIKDEDIEIPSDLYFYGFKKEESKVKYDQFNEDLFVIDCWLDTKEKEETLKELILKLKVYGAPILLCGHYKVNEEIQSLVDYFIYDGNNDLLLEKDFHKYGIESDRWSDLPEYKIINKVNFHHDYAIWLTMKNAFNFANQIGKKYVHFLEYDNLPDEVQYRQSFLEYIRHHDAVIQEYDENSTKLDNPYSAAYIFSIRTHIGQSMIGLINSKEEFFKNKPNSWQLEKQLYQSIRKITNNIFVSKYIPNNNELNLFAAWNRNGILKNGAKFQTYFGVDEDKNLYVHFISGFDNDPANKDYLVEINYRNYKKFYTIKKGHYHIENLGMYKQNEVVKIFYSGVKVVNETLTSTVDEYRRRNKVETKKIFKDQKNTKVNINFIDGPFVEILNDNNSNYHVEFINLKNNKVEYELNLKSNHWAKCSIKYYVNWLIRIKGIDNDYHLEYKFNPKKQRIFIAFETKSLGDNLANIPYVEEFRKQNDCDVICATFFNDLFREQYSNIQFVEPGSNVGNLYALYRLGMFYTENRESICYSCHPTDPKTEPLTKIASDILGLSYKEIKPKLKKIGKSIKKRVSIAVHSTAQCKYWNNPNGWQEITDYLNEKGYEVRLLSKEEDGYMGNINPKGVIIQPNGTLNDVIEVLQESELFIGISSGLSWLSWASGTPTILISGFTDVYTEPLEGISRIINKDVCNSCWNKFDFDMGDWNWCPVHKNTDKQFECSKNITSQDVIREIDKLLF